ncbi:MAG: shikimate dehydrogenase [Planctomycetaceae bacterium TMED10]|nr:MAG: shikimate dehydrogenase [Planctomycetaceae bacterium TMED10]
MLNFKQELTGAFGQPIAENPTQAMVEAAYRHHQLDWRYLSIEVAPDGLADAVEGAKAMGFIGFNCTIPHKVSVIQYLDGLGDSAALMGAVNCVVRRGVQWIGENTDGKGFVESLCRRFDPVGKNVVLFGAGGAARAISVELCLAGIAGITIVNRTAERGQSLAELLSTKVTDSVQRALDIQFALWDGVYEVPSDADLVINATSIGLYPDTKDTLPIVNDSIQPQMFVADVIPNPPETHFIQMAKARGCEVIDGLEMLVAQGVIGIRHWAGIDADAVVMRQALENVFDA